MIAGFHLVLLLLTYLSPFVVDWKIILVFIFLYYAQIVVFGNCILTTLQFKEAARDTTFYSYILTKLGLSPNKKLVRMIVDFYLPWLILFLAVFWQVYLGNLVMITL